MNALFEYLFNTSSSMIPSSNSFIKTTFEICDLVPAFDLFPIDSKRIAFDADKLLTIAKKNKKN